MLQLLRIFFTKTKTAAYISHLDLQRVMSRGLRKSGLPVWWSQGFNPHIYMSFSLPLPLLHQSKCESVDVKTESEDTDFSMFIKPLNDALPSGINVSAIALPKKKADEITKAEYTITYPDDIISSDKLMDIVAKYAEKEKVMVVRTTKRSKTDVNLKEVLPSLDINETGDAFLVSLPAGSQNHYSPALLTQYLESEFSLSANAAGVMREKVFCADGSLFC